MDLSKTSESHQSRPQRGMQVVTAWKDLELPSRTSRRLPVVQVVNHVCRRSGRWSQGLGRGCTAAATMGRIADDDGGLEVDRDGGGTRV